MAAARVRVLENMSGSGAARGERARVAGADEGRGARGLGCGVAWRLRWFVEESANGCGRVQRGAAPLRGGDVM